MSAKSPVVLIAEDSEVDVMMLRRAFKDAGLLKPLQVVQNGEEAIFYLEGQGKFADRAKYPLPDLFLLDLRMPRKNGFEVLEWLRRQPGLLRLPTIVLTTSDQIKDVNRAYELGANSFLTKPLNFVEFKDSIQAIYNYWTTLSRTPDMTPLPPRVNPFLSDQASEKQKGRTLEGSKS
ncbi:MAG: response regulator [Verrucomicrobia subdivision 3 bacterium]|nr:response regulator [Limisphaerales bacterium]